MNFDEVFNAMVEAEIATEEEINLVCQINGISTDTLNDIVYARTGYHSFEDYMDGEGVESSERYFEEM